MPRNATILLLATSIASLLVLAIPATAQVIIVPRVRVDTGYDPGVSRLGRLPDTRAPEPFTRPRSWQALRDAGVTRQAYDYSCGAAALATLLATERNGVDELSILEGVFDGLDDDERNQTMREGLSLLDLKKAAEIRGYQAEGYRVPAATLAKIQRSVIVFVKPGGYRHFAVFRGVRGDRVFLADPARGNVRYPIWRFLEMWQDENGEGVVFITSKDEPPTLRLAMDALPHPELTAVRPLGPVGLGFVPNFLPPLSIFTVDVL